MKPCSPYCPMTACDLCIWAGGVEPQGIPDDGPVAETDAIAYDKGAKQTAPGVASTNTEGLAQPKL